MAEYEYKAIRCGKKIEKLIVFLHGYNSYIPDVEPYAERLASKIQNAVIVIPLSDMVSERNPKKRQWYGLNDIDPELDRRNPKTTTTEIVKIYNRTGARISQTSAKLNHFISSLQQQYKVKNKNTFVMGFSQGAMLSIYIGLTRRYELGGVFSFSGIVCGEEMLEKESYSHPDVYLFHGTKDLAVQYKTLNYTKGWLEDHDVFWQAVEYDGIEHKLTEEEMDDTAEIINSAK